MNWPALDAMTGPGGALILVATLSSLPALWRPRRPDGPHTE